MWRLRLCLFPDQTSLSIPGESYHPVLRCMFGFGTGKFDVYEIQSCSNFATHIAGDHERVGDCMENNNISLAPALPTVCEGPLGQES
mmetsp:Transcript_101528/g.163717  ORF Transcript_101528/g.163717 Transcript_101528/m.163717 type:complete len:87 (-) Transcript_101528:78-338(-)